MSVSQSAVAPINYQLPPQTAESHRFDAERLYSDQSRLWASFSTNDRCAYLNLAGISPALGLAKWHQLSITKRKKILNAMALAAERGRAIMDVAPSFKSGAL